MTCLKPAIIAVILYGVFFQYSNAIYTPVYGYTPVDPLSQAAALSDPLYDYRDAIYNPPYNGFCDCDLSPYMDPLVVAELARIAELYNQRTCDLHTWYFLIDGVMPTLEDPWRLGMIESLAHSIYDEQARRQLAYLPEYPSFCNYIYSNPPVLVKRSPQVSPVAPVVNPLPTNPASSSYFAYYYNMMYLLDRVMPNLSPQLARDIEDSVYANSQLPQLGQSAELIRRLELNARVMLSEMIDYTPVLY